MNAFTRRVSNSKAASVSIWSSDDKMRAALVDELHVLKSLKKVSKSDTVEVKVEPEPEPEINEEFVQIEECNDKDENV